MKVQFLSYISHTSRGSIATCGYWLPCWRANNISIIVKRQHCSRRYFVFTLKCSAGSRHSMFTWHNLCLVVSFYQIRFFKACNFILKFTPCVVHSTGFGKCMTIAWIHHYRIIQNRFTALKIPCAPPIHSFLLSFQPLATNYLFTVSMVLSFPEYHTVEIIK